MLFPRMKLRKRKRVEGMERKRAVRMRRMWRPMMRKAIEMERMTRWRS